MTKRPSPDNIPLPFYEQIDPQILPKDERAQRIASFMIDATEPVHSFSDQPPKIEKVLESDSKINTGTPRYDVILDPEASEAAQDQGWGRMPVFHKPMQDQANREKLKLSNRQIESRHTGHGQEPPVFDPSITPSADSVPMTQEIKDFGRNLEIQKILQKFSEGGKELTLEQATFIFDNRRKDS